MRLMGPGDDGQYHDIMPIVAVQSNGGPYQDADFLAGMLLGQIDTALTHQPEHASWTIPAELLPQLDLLAMHHHYRFEVIPMEHDDPTCQWVGIELTKLLI
jgi:hypothetical protein